MIAVIKYNAGNILSVMNALWRLGKDAVLTDDPDTIRKADRVIFPGVGEASSAMRYIREHALDEVIVSLQRPFLGICLGLQLMCSYSEEGDTECLGIFSDKVSLFPSDRGYKIPHVGWNTITNLRGSLFCNELEDEYMYFVHSYYVPMSKYCTSVTEYDGLSFSSSLEKDNFIGVQFHPEKSGKMGNLILKRFLEEL